MELQKTASDLEEALVTIPVLDVHTHLDADHLAARGLHDLLLYHMVISDLHSAGCPDGHRLSEAPDRREAHDRIRRALPYVPYIANTSCCWGLRILLQDLYGWKEPITGDNWQRLDGMIRERSADRSWPGEVMKKAGIRRTCTELWRGRNGRADKLLQYSLEWAFFARCQWGEYDTALYELERTMAQQRPEPPLPVTLGDKRPKPRHTIKTTDDIAKGLDHYVGLIPCDRVLSTAQHISTDMDYRPIGGADINRALKRRKRAGAAERDMYAAYILEEFLGRMERLPRPIVFQFSLAAEPLPTETASRVTQNTLAQLGGLIARHPRLHFQCFLSSLHANQTLCTLARQLPNFSLAGYWWHNFFPCFIREVMRQRLDMLSVNKQIGFFSDAYCVEWSYAKLAIVRRMLAGVLAEKIAAGQYDRDTASAVARSILWESPQRLLGMSG